MISFLYSGNKVLKLVVIATKEHFENRDFEKILSWDFEMLNFKRII